MIRRPGDLILIVRLILFLFPPGLPAVPAVGLTFLAEAETVA